MITFYNKCYVVLYGIFVIIPVQVKRGGDLDQMFLQEQRPEEDFNEVVDQDDERVQAFVSQELVGAMIDSVVFRFVVIGIIVVNAILIGLQTDEKMVRVCVE